MNRLLFNQYKLKRASLMQRGNLSEVERTLYHGTSESSVKEILIHGFNRSFCGKNGMFVVALFSCLIHIYLATSDIFFSPHSHCLWSGGVFCCQLCAVCQGSVFPPKRRWTQVYLCVEGVNRRLHQRMPFDESSST